MISVGRSKNEGILKSWQKEKKENWKKTAPPKKTREDWNWNKEERKTLFEKVKDKNEFSEKWIKKQVLKNKKKSVKMKRM